MANTTGDSVGRWARGDYYGPVLSQTDLYLLNVPLELHPILRNADPGFHLQFDLTLGNTVGLDASNRDRDVPFTQRDQPATLPRVEQLIVITPASPWCTIVKNDSGSGVTLGDVCAKIFADYSLTIADAEFNALSPRMQEVVRRFAHNNANNTAGAQGWAGYQPYFNPTLPPREIKRFNWLRDRKMLDCLTKEGRDQYIRQRLGYTAPNIFVMELTI